MKAYFMQRGVQRRILLIAPEQMEKLLARPTLKVATGFPAYFDMHKRLWPQPAVGIEVTFVSESEAA
jgi:hypothetical protein